MGARGSVEYGGRFGCENVGDSYIKPRAQWQEDHLPLRKGFWCELSTRVSAHSDHHSLEIPIEARFDYALEGMPAFPIEIHIAADPTWDTYQRFKADIKES
jgi:hypothetical protein